MFIVPLIVILNFPIVHYFLQYHFIHLLPFLIYLARLLHLILIQLTNSLNPTYKTNHFIPLQGNLTLILTKCLKYDFRFFTPNLKNLKDPLLQFLFLLEAQVLSITLTNNFIIILKEQLDHYPVNPFTAFINY